jgi:hypothetical protein
MSLLGFFAEEYKRLYEYCPNGEGGGVDPTCSPHGSATGHDEYKRAGNVVAGLKVRKDVPNLGSISASLSDYEELPGIREVPLSAFDPQYKPARDDSTTALAKQISKNKEINPLIVAIDDQGPYIIEGGHRFDAMYLLGMKSFPAVVVIDKTAKHPKFRWPTR